MKDKELKFEEIESSHTSWIRGRSCPGEREVERVHILLWYRTIQYRYLVTQKQERVLVVGHSRNQRT